MTRATAVWLGSLSIRALVGAWLVGIMFLCSPLAGASASSSTLQHFDLPVDTAEASLKQFSAQSGLDVIFSTQIAMGVKTNAVKGEFTATEAIRRMLADTGLVPVWNEASGVLTVSRPPLHPMSTKPPARSAGFSQALLSVLFTFTSHLSAQTSAPAPSAVKDQDIVQMSPYEVVSDKDNGYRKAMSTTTSRIAMDVVKNPQAVEIVSGDMVKDFGATDMWQALRYSSSITVVPNAVAQNNQFNLRGFQVPVYVNGVSVPNVGATFSRMLMDNIDRIEIAKGPVGLYYGVSTPNGVANYITKKPEFRQASRLEMSLGNYQYRYAGVDTQGIMNKKLGLAYRLISSFTDYNGRVDNQRGTDLFVAPSVVFRPNNKVEVSMEYDLTKSKTPYATNAYTMAVNPQYYQDYLHPTAETLQYFKTT